MKDTIELSTGLPISDVIELDENNPVTQVDWHFIRMVLTRLKRLQEIAPEHLAQSDITRTLRHVEILKEHIRRNSNQ